ncbi:uncharacterized protein SRS1_11904 [Sporisorium reilianum f. sp. reilianum]|uniref:Uncharacterized protein n=1 Tax=Sporisorium reilianum f. sp. reilianum TaxID=72559 RepID=A0A2N8U6I7_9BASI|nr:uncharacterized protein SRS1_11904 [Sporisorium reilianum f. sp. reilianum]
MSAAPRSHTEPTTSGLDTLSSACYTIPWRPKKKAKKAPSTSSSTQQPPFPVLAEFEADGDPARVRYASYQIAVQRTEALFDRCMDGVYSSLFDDLRSFFKAQQTASHPEASTLASVGIAQQDLFLPGFESADLNRPSSNNIEASINSIQTALLISTSAPYLSSFSNRLVSQISNASQDGPPSIVVTLSASECSNLYTALRLLVARFIAQGSALDSAAQVDLSDIEAAAFAGKVEPDLHVLGSWWSNKFAHSQRRPRLVLNLPTIESVEPTVLSDLLSALQTFVAEPSSSTSAAQAPLSRPQLMLVLGITSPSGGLAAVSADGIGAASSSSNATAAPAPWIDYIPRQVLRVLDISRFSLPSKELVWSRLVQTFLTSRELPLSLGPSTFEYIRETYWERDADLDSVLDAVRLACFIHFSGKPESVFTIPGQAKRVRFYSWTPKMVERIKIAFLTTDEAGDLVLPLLAPSHRPSELDVNSFLHEASRSDQFILGELDQLRHPRELLCFRLEFSIRFLSRAFEALMRIQSRASTAAQALHARNANAAAQQGAEMDEQRQLERASEMLTQVVMQCLNASVGALEARRRVPVALTLRSGLARLCNAARRLLSDEFETLLDEMVAAAEDEVARIEEAMADHAEVDEVDERPPGQLRSAAASITAQSAQFLAGLRTFQQRLSQTIVADTAGIAEDEDAELAAAASTAAAGAEGAQAAQQRREARLQRVQRKLLMEEKLLGLKREITDWIVHSLHDLVDWKHITRSFSASDNGPLHLLRDIFWVDCYAPLSTLLDPSTRAGLTLPLSEPLEFVESLYDAALSVVPENELDDIDLDGLKRLQEPDVCRLFQLYLECGKFVNLADWFEAFKQTVEVDRIADEAERDLRREASQLQQGHADEGEPSTPSRRQGARKRTIRDMAQSDDDSDVLDTPSKSRRGPERDGSTSGAPESELQSRFALALNELARMGMIRGTRRRQEHITKVMWDLVPDSF